MKCLMYSIERQKRDLSHVHLLLWLMEKLRHNQIDEIISAEIPNAEADRKLYDNVTKSMIHSPCGALNPSSPCTKEGKCTQTYPRGLLKETKTNDKSYPLYRRRASEDGGHTLTQKTRGRIQENKYKVVLPEDILRRFERMDRVNNDLCLNEALRHIEEKIIRISGKKLSDFGMPIPQRRGELSTDLIKELSYNTALLDTQVSGTEPRLLPEQKDIYNKILQRVELGEGSLFFLYAPGSTGKTFLLNLLLAKICNGRNVTLAVASSGIAATLLSGGRTAHSVFKFPLNLASEETPTCKISKNSPRGTLLQ
ncbi:ATP-dependent DNA helicase [Trichonephila clavipes]|uniref:ATP-dependent DNA helicase n=1 Tax=Trichonephila clavipes TaxID=2585209 RepID=A0A8X6RMG7_TRICX|nr:ATP-dependent DNA helicase [Trichonephila clavipes]